MHTHTTHTHMRVCALTQVYIILRTLGYINPNLFRLYELKSNTGYINPN